MVLSSQRKMEGRKERLQFLRDEIQKAESERKEVSFPNGQSISLTFPEAIFFEKEILSFYNKGASLDDDKVDSVVKRKENGSLQICNWKNAFVFSDAYFNEFIAEKINELNVYEIIVLFRNLTFHCFKKVKGTFMIQKGEAFSPEARILEIRKGNPVFISKDLYETFLLIRHFSKACFVCFREGKRKVCSGCGKTKYCSKECQKSDWKAHRTVCSSIKEATSFFIENP